MPELYTEIEEINTKFQKNRTSALSEPEKEYKRKDPPRNFKKINIT